MLRVTIELVPFGVGQPKEIGRILIANDGTSDDPDVGHYDVWQGRRDCQDDRAIHRSPVRTGRVENHRRNSKPVWSLIAKCLRSLGY